MLAYITGTVDQELLLRNEYLAAENRILRLLLTKIHRETGDASRYCRLPPPNFKQLNQANNSLSRRCEAELRREGVGFVVKTPR
jgi:hypothetical protein